MGKELSCQDPVLMVVDIGGSKYMPGYVDGAGHILYQERREWTSVEPESIAEQLKTALSDIRRKCPELAEQAAAGGLTIPGFADPATGLWVESDYLPVRNLDICRLLGEETGIPFFADNDCNACALAERYFGGAKGLENFLYLTVSTGIGGALYLNGELWYGGYWHAGEIGLFVVEENGRPSDTGSVNGVVEMYASGRGLTRNYIEAGGKELIDGKSPGGPEIAGLAKQGDRAASRALELEGGYLGRIIANACAAAGFEKIILGGGLSLLFDLYQDALFTEYRRIRPGQPVVIEPTGLGYSGAFLGAAAVALRGFKGLGTGACSGRPDQISYHIQTTGDRVEGWLEAEGGIRCKADFGSFLAAPGIDRPGQSLNEIIGLWNVEELAAGLESGDKEAGKVLFSLGSRLGKAAACACILLDPGTLILEGPGTQCGPFREGLLETVKRETYYRGRLPFVIEYR